MNFHFHLQKKKHTHADADIEIDTSEDRRIEERRRYLRQEEINSNTLISK